MGENYFLIKKKKQRENNYIPVDEILVHFPARHLQIVKSVCKDWLHLIASDYFIRRHLSKAINRIIRVLLTFPPTKIDYYDPPTILDYYENTLVQIPYPPQFSKSTATIAGSADGLICMLDVTTKQGVHCKAAIFNPSTGKCFTSHLWTKEYGYDVVFSWFGKYHNNNNPEYVLVLGTWTRTESNTLNARGWPTLGTPRVEFEVYKYGGSRTSLNRTQSVFVDRLANQPFHAGALDQRGTLVQGVVHWPIQQYNVRKPGRFKILAYHIDSNTHSEISAPVQRGFRLGVGIAGGGLFATLKNYEQCVFEVWVMKEDSCWTKYASIDIKGFSIRSVSVLSPLGFFPNGDMVLDVNKSKLIRYSFNDNEEVLLTKYDRPRNDAIMCGDSLVSP